MTKKSQQESENTPEERADCKNCKIGHYMRNLNKDGYCPTCAAEKGR